MSFFALCFYHRTFIASVARDQSLTFVPPFVPSLVLKIPRTPPTKGKKVITTKARRRKLSPNVPIFLINGVSFHSEDSVHKWKYVIQH